MEFLLFSIIIKGTRNNFIFHNFPFSTFADIFAYLEKPLLHTNLSSKAVLQKWPRGRGHLYLKLDIFLIKKIHVIRVFFQDKAMYTRTSFRVQKCAKLEKKGVFLAILTSFGKDMMDKPMQKHIFRVYSHTWKIHVKGVFWKSFYEDDIQPEIQVPPPPGKWHIQCKRTKHLEFELFFLWI